MPVMMAVFACVFSLILGLAVGAWAAWEIGNVSDEWWRR